VIELGLLNGPENCDGWPDSARFPVNFLVSREFGAETGSQLTASYGPSKSRGFAPFAGYYAVSASRIERRKRRSHHLSPRGIFRVSFLMEHSASVPVDPTNAPDADESLCGACAPRRNMREGAQEVATRGLDGARWPPVDGSAASAKSRWCERFGRPPFRLAHADLAVQTSLGQGLRGSRRSTVPG
jgi:hypothetical protein